MSDLSPEERQAVRRKKAIALEYDQRKSNAPTVLAKGEGWVAQRIVDLAQEADVPVVEDAALVSALLSLELGEEIPAELYQAVAKILSWVYKLEKGESH